MARTILSRTLPPLPRRLIREREAKNGDDLLGILRRTASAAQAPEAKPFYSMREIAQHFHVPLSKVARTYSELEQRGTISRIRGSRTILQGSAPTRQLIVRSIVGMPASLSCFMTLQDYRMFFIEMCREFRRRGFVTVMAFYEDRFDAQDLAERIRQARADIVLWYLPDTAARVTAPRLRDMGIPLLGISDGGLPSVPCRYAVRRERAIRTILQDWVVSGIRQVLIARSESRSTADEERLETILAETSLDWRVVSPGSSSPEKFLAKLGSQKGNAIILLASAACFFLMRAPERFYRMLNDHRVALVDGPVSLPLSPPTAASVDLVVVDWQNAAEHIANDILSRNAFIEREPVLFEATAELRKSLNKFAQKI